MTALTGAAPVTAGAGMDLSRGAHETGGLGSAAAGALAGAVGAPGRVGAGVDSGAAHRVPLSGTGVAPNLAALTGVASSESRDGPHGTNLPY